jgi:hypothetical protein
MSHVSGIYCYRVPRPTCRQFRHGTGRTIETIRRHLRHSGYSGTSRSDRRLATASQPWKGRGMRCALPVRRRCSRVGGCPVVCYAKAGLSVGECAGMRHHGRIGSDRSTYGGLAQPPQCERRHPIAATCHGCSHSDKRKACVRVCVRTRARACVCLRVCACV